MSRLQESDPRKTITVRVDESTKEAYKSEVDSMSKDLREHIQDVAGNSDREMLYLGDELLEDGYRALKDAVETHTAPGARKIDKQTATSEVANALDMPAESIRPRIFEPLESRGLIRPAWGALIVREVDHE
jgi:hypothetical protein